MSLKLKSRTRVERPRAVFRPPPRDVLLGCGGPADAVTFYIPRSVLESLFRHAVAHPRLEVGGYLFGHAYVAGESAVVEVRGAYSITSGDATVASFRFEIEDSVRAERFQTERFPGTDIVGWYHTHPGHGVFMSGVDVNTHVRYFKLFHRVALVIDPLHKEFAAFVQRDGDVHSLATIHVVEDEGTAPGHPGLPLPPLDGEGPPPGGGPATPPAPADEAPSEEAPPPVPVPPHPPALRRAADRLDHPDGPPRYYWYIFGGGLAVFLVCVAAAATMGYYLFFVRRGW
jgi:proteasome lid subunit RPN8/RPN11